MAIIATNGLYFNTIMNWKEIPNLTPAQVAWFEKFEAEATRQVKEAVRKINEAAREAIASVSNIEISVPDSYCDERKLAYFEDCLSKRTINSLHYGGIDTIAQLIVFIDKNGYQKLRLFRNAGKKTVAEIRSFVELYRAKKI